MACRFQIVWHVQWTSYMNAHDTWMVLNKNYVTSGNTTMYSIAFNSHSSAWFHPRMISGFCCVAFVLSIDVILLAILSTLAGTFIQYFFFCWKLYMSVSECVCNWELCLTTVPYSIFNRNMLTYIIYSSRVFLNWCFPHGWLIPSEMKRKNLRRKQKNSDQQDFLLNNEVLIKNREMWNFVMLSRSFQSYFFIFHVYQTYNKVLTTFAHFLWKK